MYEGRYMKGIVDTIGTQHITIGEFIKILKKYGIKIVIDVAENC